MDNRSISCTVSHSTSITSLGACAQEQHKLTVSRMNANIDRFIYLNLLSIFLIIDTKELRRITHILLSPVCSWVMLGSFVPFFKHSDYLHI